MSRSRGLSLCLCLVALSSARGVSYVSQDRSVSASNSKGDASGSAAADFSPFNATADVTWERTVPPEWEDSLSWDTNVYSATGTQNSTLSPYGITIEGNATETGPFNALESYYQSSASLFEVTFDTTVALELFLHGELSTLADYGGTCGGWYETWIELSGSSGEIFSADWDGTDWYASPEPWIFDEAFLLGPGRYTLSAGATADGGYFFDDPWPGVGGGGFADYLVQVDLQPIPAPAALWLGLIGTSLALRPARSRKRRFFS